jgi:hypothetical protein
VEIHMLFRIGLLEIKIYLWWMLSCPMMLSH